MPYKDILDLLKHDPLAIRHLESEAIDFYREILPDQAREMLGISTKRLALCKDGHIRVTCEDPIEMLTIGQAYDKFRLPGLQARYAV